MSSHRAQPSALELEVLVVVELECVVVLLLVEVELVPWSQHGEGSGTTRGMSC